MLTLKFLQITISLFLCLSLIQAQNPTNSTNLDESPPLLENKCGDCPCDNPCNPPPSPPPPSPPPPPKNPPSNECPPPPAVKPPKTPNPPYIFINGPPGSVYPVYSNISGGRRCFSIAKVPFLITFVLWRLLAF